MSLVVPWLVFPIVLGALSLGCGLLVERTAGLRLGALRLPAGLALVIVAGLFTTFESFTARATSPLIVVLAAAGFLASFPRPFGLPRLPSLSLVLCALGVFAAYAAPVVLSGQATFTGYVKLDDTATFLGFTDQIMAHGRDLSSVVPSTYWNALRLNIGEGYPVGTFVPLGVGSKLVGQDPAWTYQPAMAFYAAALSLGLYSLLEDLVSSRAIRAFSAFVAAQAALIYGYALWGGIKELAATAMLALAAALVPVRRDQLLSARGLLPFAIATAATLGALSVTGMLWIALLALPALVLLARGPRRTLISAGAGVAAIAILSIPSLAVAQAFVHYTTSNLLTQSERLGNLAHPIKLIQIFGIWINGDFRYTPVDYTPTRILIALCALAALAGAVLAVRRRAIRPPLVALACAAAALFLDVDSSPWLTAKALATGSVFMVLLALACAGVLAESGRAVEGAVLAIAIGGGVLWSNVLGYKGAWLAPRAQLVELQQIGSRFAGDGPALMTEYQPYGVRHFLRKLDPEGASELRVRLVPLLDGQGLQPGAYADLDQFRYPDILTYRTFVLRTSPVESRPSSAYRLVWQGRFYDVWERPASGGPTVIEHIPLGTDTAPSAVASCAVIRDAATLAKKDRAMLAVAQTPDPVFVQLGNGTHPPGWSVDDGAPQTVTPTGPGTLTASVTVAASGDYSLWLNGTIFRRTAIAIDGKHVGAVASSGSLYAPFGTVHLSRGTHSVTLEFGSAKLAPGTAATIYPLGPLALTPAHGSSAVRYVTPADAGTLCGKPLDWIEVVRA